MMRGVLIATLCLCLGLAGCSSVSAQPQTNQAAPAPLVLTSVGPIYSITAALVKGANISVKNVPERARALSSQPTWFAKQAAPFYGDFEQATAVVTMGQLWHADSLYLSVREHNIRVVNIDATLPYSSEATGISVVNSPVSGDASPYFWLSPANLIRSTKLISADLQRLFPDSGATILANERELSAQLVNLKTGYERDLISVADPFVFALADEFDYLANEFGIFVDGYFVKQDLDWTEDDYAALTKRLQDSAIPVVIHKWEPSAEIQAAVAAGGSRLVVLDTFESQSAGMIELVSKNLDTLLAGFQTP